MAERRPLVVIGGQVQELPNGDTVPGTSGGGGGSVSRTPVAGTNLDFESQDLTGWTTETGTPQILQALAGSSFGNTVDTWHMQGGLSNDTAEISQVISVDPSSVLFYEFGATFSKDFADQDQGRMRVQFLNASDEILMEETIQDPSTQISRQTISKSAVPPLTTAKIKVFAATVRNSGSNNNCAIDDLFINAVSVSGDGGSGVPNGGTTGQVLKKNSNDDGDASWQDDEVGAAAALGDAINPFKKTQNLTATLFDTVVHGDQTVSVANGNITVEGGTGDSLHVKTLTNTFTHCVFKMRNQGTQAGNEDYQDGGIAFRQAGATNYVSIGLGTGSGGASDYDLRVLEWTNTASAYVGTHGSDIDIGMNEVWVAVFLNPAKTHMQIYYSTNEIDWIFKQSLQLSLIDGMTAIEQIGVRSGDGDDFDLEVYSDDDNPYMIKGDVGPAGPAGAPGTSAIFETPAYTNEGGQGDRQNIIGATYTGGGFVGQPGKMLDGNTGTNSTNAWYFNTGGTTGLLSFFFLDYKTIEEITWKQNTVAAHGDWVIEASNDGINFVVQSSSFTLGTTTSQVIPVDLTDGLGYKIWRLRQVSGTTSNSPWLTEIEFKIGNAVRATTGFIQESIDAATYSTVNADFSGNKFKLVRQACTITVEPGHTQVSPCTFVPTTAGMITFAAGSGVTLISTDGLLSSRVQGSSLTVVQDKDNLNTYLLMGDLG